MEGKRSTRSVSTFLHDSLLNATNNSEHPAQDERPPPLEPDPTFSTTKTNSNLPALPSSPPQRPKQLRIVSLRDDLPSPLPSPISTPVAAGSLYQEVLTGDDDDDKTILDPSSTFIPLDEEGFFLGSQIPEDPFLSSL